MCAPYFANLNNNTFRLKTLLFFVHLRHSKREQKKSSPIIKFTVLHFDIVILRVAIMSNVQNVRLQRRDMRTDDTSTRRWRGSQQANNDILLRH